MELMQNWDCWCWKTWNLHVHSWRRLVTISALNDVPLRRLVRSTTSQWGNCERPNRLSSFWKEGSDVMKSAAAAVASESLPVRSKTSPVLPGLRM
jgi:hypothetical protein